MAKLLTPRRGHWYKRPDLNDVFEVVAIDDDEGTIEIQYFNGEIEELDLASWQELYIAEAAAPEDWSGALEVESYAINDRMKESPGNLSDALNHLDINEN
ncbi:DUF6763 family protein [Kangiella sp. HZ709]|uniref:DUF6763 family protein n=1 Tax=Kangiella sp. HZ709 TaxID=2666328 RepID=UPI0012AF7D2A|nr:DUF6763 family protein [Kangiella sp. HZ709]MRX26995.1 hypothetical protein [Kangiella sp. HZ709]